MAPDVAAGPLYAVLRSKLPPKYQGGKDGPLAVTSRHLDLMLCPTLERQGRWRGRGPAMLLDPSVIARDAAARPRPTRHRTFRPTALGVVLHGLAHIIDAGPREEAEPDPALMQFGRLSLAANLTSTEPPTNGPGAVVPWRGHECAFVRITLHLAHRAAQLGVELLPADVKALGDEAARLCGCTFDRIRHTPPAPPYARLREIRAAVSEASDARRKLITTCPDSALREELAAVSDRLNERRTHAAALWDRGALVKQADREEEAAATGPTMAGFFLMPVGTAAGIDRLSFACPDAKSPRGALHYLLGCGAGQTFWATVAIYALTCCVAGATVLMSVLYGSGPHHASGPAGREQGCKNCGK